MPSPGSWNTGVYGMIQPGDATEDGHGLRRFAMDRLPPLLVAFTKEIPGVRTGKDIEYIHRMRVASRRLRAALPLFEPCFPAKEFRVWMREITKITRSLGEARDTDVQIAFLAKLERKNSRGTGRGRRRLIPVPGAESAAIRFLLAALRRRRELLQKRVLASLDGLEQSGITGAMAQEFARQEAELRSVRRKSPEHNLPAIAAYRISRRLSRILSYDPWIRHPEAVAEHHAARIAAKKLRYTMEVYGPLYRTSLKKPLTRVKKVQEILGDIHDRDVWIDHVTQILLRERTLLRRPGREDRPDTATLASLKVFLRQRETERLTAYRRFVRFWDSLSRTGLWTDLRRTMDTGRRTRYLPPPALPDGDVMAAVMASADQDPGTLEHCRQVCRLALMLFDAILPLSRAGPRDRILLGSAAILHDTGSDGGETGHGRKGARVLFTGESLPFDLQERAIICTAIACHRGRTDPADLPYHALMSPENQKRALRISALLRIADGLDFLHSGAVREIRCTLVSDKVFLDIQGTGDLAAEKERARIRSDLFFRAFASRPVIR